MSVSIPCKEICDGCEELIRGSSLDELVENAAAHAVDTHGLSASDAGSHIVLIEIRASIPQTSRSREFRVATLSFIKS